MNILFLGFKNRASFLFIKPIFNSLIDINSESSITISADSKYLYELLKNDQLKELEKYINKNKLILFVINPIFPIKTFLKSLKNSFDNKKKFISYIVINSRLIFQNLFYFYKFLYLAKSKSLQFKIKDPNKLIKEKFYKVLFITGTNHHSSKEIILDISKYITNNSKIIWLPHAPHHGSLKNNFPNILKNFNCKVDIWLPSEKEFISNHPKNYSIFNSGYPPFDKSSLVNDRGSIIKNKNKDSIILLLRQFKKKSDPKNYFISENEILNFFKLVKNFYRKNKKYNFIICPHPSVNISRLNYLIKLSGIKKFKIGNNYFLNYVNEDTIVLGSYSTVLLHSALLGLRTVCFNDSIIKYLKTKETYFYSLYISFPIFCINPNLEEFENCLSKFYQNNFYDFEKDKRFINSPIYKFNKFSINSIDKCKERIFNI